MGRLRQSWMLVQRLSLYFSEVRVFSAGRERQPLLAEIRRPQVHDDDTFSERLASWSTV